MSNTSTTGDIEFLLRAANAYDPSLGLRNQRELFLKSWTLLTDADRQQAAALWLADRNDAASADPGSSDAAAAISNDPQFLLRAAGVVKANALANQQQMFRDVWSRIPPPDQEELVTLWRHDDPGPRPSESNPGREVPAAALDLVKTFEGYGKALPDGRAEAYPDPIAGWQVPTIGFGTTRYPDGRAVKQGDVISRDQAGDYLRDELERHCRPSLERIPTWKQMTSNQRSALYSFAYNLGPGFYRGADFASITRVCDSPERWGEQAWVSEQFVKYRNPGSSAEAGLKRRRLAEASLFCKP